MKAESNETSNIILNFIEAVQKRNGKDNVYLSKIVLFAKEHQDIKAALIYANNDISDIVIVVDDTTKDAVLSYNDFLFDMRDRYSEVHDFMIVDEDMLEAVKVHISDKRSPFPAPAV